MRDVVVVAVDVVDCKCAMEKVNIWCSANELSATTESVRNGLNSLETQLKSQIHFIASSIWIA